MTIKKENMAKGKGKDVSKNKNEVTSSTSKSSMTDLTRKSSTSSIKHEVVSSSSTVQESKNVTASEKRTNTVEMSSSSREIIMDADGKIIKVIENKPQKTVQTASTSRSGKSSQDLIADEQRQLLKERKEIERANILQDQKITSTGQSHIHESEINKSFDTNQIFDSSQNFDTSHHHYHPSSYSRSMESSESKRIVTEGHTTKDGQMIISTIKIDQSDQKFDDNGKVTSTTCHNIDSDITIDKRSMDDKKKSDRLKLGDSTWDGKFVYEKPVAKDRSIKISQKSNNDERFSSSSIHEQTSESKQENFTSLKDLKVSSTDTTDFARRRDSERLDHSPVRYTKPGDSTWDGKFIFEKPEPKKKTVSYDLRDSDSTRFTTEKKIDIRDGQETNIKSIIRDSPSPTRRVTKPGDSTWDGHFVYEKPKDVTVVRKTEKRNDSVEVQDVTEDINLMESASSSYIIEYNTEGDKKIEKVTSVSDVIIEEDDGPSPRKPKEQPRIYRLGDSAWDGKFVYEKPFSPHKRPSDIRRVDRRSETVDIREVTEDNSINEADILTTSYVIEDTSSEKNFIIDDQRPKNVKTIFVEVEGQDYPKRSQSPEKSRITKPGSSTWDGTFIMERSPETKRTASPDYKSKFPDSKPNEKERDFGSKYDQRKLEPIRKKNISDTTLDLTDDEVVRSSFIIQKSSTHESYSDSQNVDFSTTSVETVVIQDGQNITDDHPIKFLTTETLKDFRGPSDQKKPTDQDRKKPIVDQRRPSSPEKRIPTPEERSIRPSKPGSSTWDGSFTYEKPDQKKPKKSEPKKEDTKPDRKPNLDVRKYSTDITDQTSKFDFSNTSSFTVEKSSTIESRTFDSSNISTTITDEKQRKEGPEPKPRPRTDYKSPDNQKPSEILKSPDDKTSPDRSLRPTKPGSSNWDGSFIYEKPQEKKPKDSKKPDDDKKIPNDRTTIKKPMDNIPDNNFDRRSSITKDIISTTDVIDTHDIISDSNVTVTSDVVQQSFVIEKSSSFTEVQDFRNVVEDRVISEFTKDIRQDQVS